MGDDVGLAKDQLSALARLKVVAEKEGLYLAGGTAIAVHLHHRRSLDLDLFSLSGEMRLEDVLVEIRKTAPELEIVAQTDAAIRTILMGVPVDIVKYPYPLLDPTVPGPEGFPVAERRDLASMKLAAVTRRGLKRDFWDLFALANGGLPLREATRAYVVKFGVSQSDLYHVLRSLTYFADAEKDPVYPRGLTEPHWLLIKNYFLEEVPNLFLNP